ncbi:hypothetical protein T07_11294 [Trichinella nelsoni]|uniref:Uncharacterized protein n=1 Tax=Trichinella nelsoni TaxID=6336 RepID=A0A0V0RI90_9BILA|nr:hypothetical protein T07_11294 [Trichinella nelsoni]
MSTITGSCQINAVRSWQSYMLLLVEVTATKVKVPQPKVFPVIVADQYDHIKGMFDSKLERFFVQINIADAKQNSPNFMKSLRIRMVKVKQNKDLLIAHLDIHWLEVVVDQSSSE